MITELLKSMPLNDRLSISNEMLIHTLLVDLGYKKDIPWKKHELKQLETLIKFSKELADHQITEFNQWESDGRP